MIGNVTSMAYDRTSITSGIAQKMFKKLDSNEDGGIDEKELAAISNNTSADFSQLFAQMDSNSDGKVDLEETESVLQKISSKMEAVFSKTGGSRPKPPEPPSPEEMFSKADTDGSGGIDEEEFANVIQNGDGNGPQFSDIDTNGDGVIDETENSAAFEKMGPPKGPPPGPPPQGTGGESNSIDVTSLSGSSLSDTDTFSDLLSALQDTLGDDDDDTASSIKQLFNELKNSIKYSAQGKSSMSVNGTGSLFSVQV